MGYHRAGFDEIVGVDIKPQPRYPFTFVQADALEYFESERGSIGNGFWDAIHASPPCQKYSWAAKRWNRPRADLVPATITALGGIDIPWSLENVPGAPLPHAIRLCGTQFGWK